MFDLYFWTSFKRNSGFIVLAGVHSGLIDSSCDECTNDQIKKIRGCEQPTHAPVWVIGDYEFYICPLTYLSLQIKHWYNKYRQIKNGFCKPLDYNKTNPKFFEAINIYEYYLDQGREDKKEIEKQKKNFRKLDEALTCRTKK